MKQSKKLNIDNETLSCEKIGDKLIEETQEVISQLGNLRLNKDYTSLVETIKETYDVIQVCILILWRCHRLAKNKYKKPNLVQEINLEHKDKLMCRGWEPVTGIEIEVKE